VKAERFGLGKGGPCRPGAAKRGREIVEGVGVVGTGRKKKEKRKANEVDQTKPREKRRAGEG